LKLKVQYYKSDLYLNERADMFPPKELTKEIRTKFSEHFDGWVMSSCDGITDKICVFNSGSVQVYEYENNRLITVVPLPKAKTRTRAQIDFMKFIKQDKN
jgi:hypothetical protein